MGSFCWWADSTLKWSRYLHFLLLHTTKRAFLSVQHQKWGRVGVHPTVRGLEWYWLMSSFLFDRDSFYGNKPDVYLKDKFSGRRTGLQQNYCSSLDNMLAVGAKPPLYLDPDARGETVISVPLRRMVWSLGALRGMRSPHVYDSQTDGWDCSSGLERTPNHSRHLDRHPLLLSSCLFCFRSRSALHIIEK